MPRKTILVVDDEKRVAASIAAVLRDENYRVKIAHSGQEALKMLRIEFPDLVLLDIWMPGMDGLEVLEAIKEYDPSIMVTMISGHGNIETAVKCTKLGAYDFIEKPLSMDKLLLSVKHAIEKQQLTRNFHILKSKEEEKYRIVGESQAIKEVIQNIHTAAPTNSRVLINGENGTGKELVARAIHNQSNRHKGPFVEINCAAIPEELIESELFGHEKGAFTGATRQKKGKFELADGGTIFLDEIGDMSLKTQAKVLRVLEEQKVQHVGGDQLVDVDVRVIAASNKNLSELILQQRFREDLFYRLNVIPIEVPPLRNRTEDIPLLTHHFLRIYCQENGRKLKSVDPVALEMLKHYNWPGNIRELRNIVERLVIMVPGEVITEDDLPSHISQKRENDFSFERDFDSLKEAREFFEKQYITWQLKQNDWNVTRTAEVLKIERTNLHRKMKALDIQSPE